MTIKRCDMCKNVDGIQTFWAQTGRQMDQAGSMESVGESLDLCPYHLRAGLDYVLTISPGYDLATKLVQWAKT